jgi:mannose-6-phosphate isomerase-like protein (cupin superfamily)
MKIAILAPISWRTPPRRYRPRETIVSLLTEELVQLGMDVTLFATGDSNTHAKLAWVCERPCFEDSIIDPRAWECLHIAEVFRQAREFDLIHNHLDYLPLTYSSFTPTPVVTTLHDYASPSVLPVYRKYNGHTYYVATSNASKHDMLDYIATIHHGIDLTQLPFQSTTGDYLLVFEPIHPDNGVREAIDVALKAGIRLVIAGAIQDQTYFKEQIRPFIDNITVEYIDAIEPADKHRLVGGALASLHLINADKSPGLSVIESIACGTPVIAFANGAMPEIIDDGVTGFLVADVDTAVLAIQKIDAIDRYNCRQQANNRFSCQRMALAYVDVYHKILELRENHRPWGHYEDLLEQDDHKIKELIVNPGERLSLQKHRRRAEHWTVVSGEALVTVDTKDTLLKTGQSVDVPKGAVHRIQNPGDIPLHLVEVQIGDYFGEDDIIRIQDDYNRCSSRS